ncbi:MAG: hypothetical protein R2851_24795 [Caldilineaceae bacterium]
MTIYDETLVPAYTLPDPLVDAHGVAITQTAAWPARRAAILDQFGMHVYGRTPATTFAAHAAVEEEDGHALGGAAHRKQVRLELTHAGRTLALHLLLYLPCAPTVPCRSSWA